MIAPSIFVTWRDSLADPVQSHARSCPWKALLPGPQTLIGPSHQRRQPDPNGPATEMLQNRPPRSPSRLVRLAATRLLVGRGRRVCGDGLPTRLHSGKEPAGEERKGGR